MQKLTSNKELERLRKRFLLKVAPDKSQIIVSGGTCGLAKGSQKVAISIKEELKNLGLENKVVVKTTGCLGLCEREPMVIIHPQKFFYIGVQVGDAPDIVNESVINGNIIDRLCYMDLINGKRINYQNDIPFYKKQMPIISGNNSKIDPTSIEDYITIGGYSAFQKVLNDMQPEEIIEIIKKSGLRGRGGGGFSTGKKWASCRRAEGDKKYVIINADEGDPGAYMDRSILEGNPHSVLEGLLIGAFAIGATEGFIYVRMEYPLAVKHFKKALEDAREYGLLGKNILGTGLDFDVELHQGGGAFVCGESTALMASIEGKAGEPRAKHVHTVDKGLWEKPTTLNNVETWANVPLIINKGWEWYSKIGTKNSKGTKIFSLVGKVINTGLVEVPMGMTLREIIYDVGGGIIGDKPFKAVQTGGPSGGVLPESLLDLPVDFDRLTEAGSMMGSGGMIVMDEENCMVDIARYFVKFLMDESCGKCTPCREGLIQMDNILENICNGKGKTGDIERLEELAWIMNEGSLCQLGATASNPVLTTLKYFREEYIEHIENKVCPAGACGELIKYEIEKEKCTGCLLCLKNCYSDAILGESKKAHIIIQEKCNKCGICYEICPEKFGAVVKKPAINNIIAETTV